VTRHWMPDGSFRVQPCAVVPARLLPVNGQTPVCQRHSQCWASAVDHQNPVSLGAVKSESAVQSVCHCRVPLRPVHRIDQIAHVRNRRLERLFLPRGQIDLHDAFDPAADDHHRRTDEEPTYVVVPRHNLIPRDEQLEVW
jgi:hypothetical protein